MRFHHSTRRRATRFSHGPASAAGSSSSSGANARQASRWAQLSYCRMTNIYFNRRHQIEPPAGMHCSAEESEHVCHLTKSTSANETEQQQEWPLDASESVASDNNPAPSGQQKNLNAPVGEVNNNNEHGDDNETPTKGLESQLESLLNLNGPASASDPQRAIRSASSEQVQLGSNHDNNNGKQLDSCVAQEQQASIVRNDANQRRLVTKQAGSSGHATKHNNGTATKLDIESAREKLIAQVEKHPFWSNKAAKRMRLLDVCERQIFIYELVSYSERRDLEWRYEPFRGGLAASSSNSAGTTSVLGSQLHHRRTTGRAGPSYLARQHSLVDGGANVQHVEQATAPPFPVSSITTSSSGLSASVLARTGSLTQPSSPVTLEPLKQQVSVDSEQWQESIMMAGGGSGCPGTPTSGRGISVGGGVVGAAYEQRSSSGGGYARRSRCSSSTSSPVTEVCSPRHLATAGANISAPMLPHSTGGGHDGCTPATATAADPAKQQHQLGPTASCPIERPLPSAQFVWSIEPPERARPGPFVPSVQTSELPASSFIKRCHGCNGRGRFKCSSCYGVGYEVCITCSGKGTTRHLSTRLGAHGSAALNERASSASGSQRPPESSPWAEPGETKRGHSSSTGQSKRRYDEPGGVTQSNAGTGWQTESCHYCHGAGQKRCWICAGRAYQTCIACAGTGQLRCFLNLSITWLNHRDECVLNNSDAIIPRERLRLCSGLVLFDLVANRLKPIESSLSVYAADLAASAASAASATASATATSAHQRAQQHKHPCFRDQPLDGATESPNYHRNKSTTILSQMIKPSELDQLHLISSTLLEKHQSTYAKQELLLKQRHKVTKIECFVVNWEWKQRRGHFVVYGDERKVYIAKYPFKSICSIT